MDFMLPFFISKLGVGKHNGTPRLELNQCFEEDKIYFLLHQYFHNRWSVIRFTTTTTNICNWLNYLRIFVSQFLLIFFFFFFILQLANTMEEELMRNIFVAIEKSSSKKMHFAFMVYKIPKKSNKMFSTKFGIPASYLTNIT